MVYVTIFYNDVILNPPAVRENCPSITAPIHNAIKIADSKIESGEWTAYLIPELHYQPVIFEGGI